MSPAVGTYLRLTTCRRPFSSSGLARGLAACPEPPSYNPSLRAPKKPRRKSVPVEPAPTAEWVSIAQLERLIPYHAQTIRNLMSKGVLRLGEHYVKPRGRVMFRLAAMRAWVETQQTP